MPQTGDAAQLSLVLGVLVLSAAGLAAVVNLRKRRS
ncbi:LPXTG cell wall anchor domain-containing protein [Pseudoflavonifractor capillosus]|nr:LPXTG cell wall anchor domain-containing protein [Pseudoflavonifractor sp. An44]MBM6694853.1 LPXTG cell wall anchor domain-containing protein [Pseudoflavonifractor capillosus]